jgi:peptidyl-prolyl cis-trans isomerase SurA
MRRLAGGRIKAGVLLACVIGMALTGTPAGARELVDRIVAVVEEEPIFLSDVDDAMAEVLYVARMRGEPVPSDSEEVAALREDLLESVIERHIVIAKARKLGIEITRTEVEDALDDWVNDMIRASGSQAAFEMELERQGMTLKDLKAQYRKDIENQLIVSRFMRQEFRNIMISEAEIQEFYDTKPDSIPGVPEVVGLAHIIIIPRVTTEREIRASQRIDAIMERTRAGESFASIAADMSDDAMTRANGGALGTVSIDDMREDLAAIAAGLEPGTVSEPIRTQYGIEIVRLDAREGDLHTLSHIFIEMRPSREDTLDALRRAEEVRERAASGESFEDLAETYSDDSETREKGGFVGDLEIGSLDPQYREALSDLEPGEVSGILTTAHGFQILKLTGRTVGRPPDFEEAREWIRSILESRRREELFQEWLAEARDEIYVRRVDF